MDNASHPIHITFFEAAEYCIRVAGQLDNGLSDCLAGMQIQQIAQENYEPITMLTGRVADQAELLGVLNSLYELHVSIISIEVTPYDT